MYSAFNVTDTLRFTQPRLVLAAIRGLGHETTIGLKLVDIVPCVLLRVYNIIINPNEHPAPLPEDMHEIVDGVLSCRLAYECTNPTTADSPRIQSDSQE